MPHAADGFWQACHLHVGQLGDHATRAVRGSVVHDDHLEAARDLAEWRVQIGARAVDRDSGAGGAPCQPSGHHQHQPVLDASATTQMMQSCIMLRTQISLTDDERSADDDIAVMRQGLGSWADRDTDGAEWVERIRSGRRLQDTP